MMRARDIRIGGFYSVIVTGPEGQTKTTVEIKELVSSCTWRARNTRTGGELYVLFGDLLDELPEQTVAVTAADYRRRAAGDVD